MQKTPGDKDIVLNESFIMFLLLCVILYSQILGYVEEKVTITEWVRSTKLRTIITYPSVKRYQTQSVQVTRYKVKKEKKNISLVASFLCTIRHKVDSEFNSLTLYASKSEDLE